MSLLTLVQQTFGEIGLSPPATVVGNTDANVIKALALSNRAGTELRDITKASDYWPALRKQFLFNLLGIGPFTGTFTPNSPVITNVTGTNLAGVQPGWQVASTFALNDTSVVSVNAGAGTVTMSQNSTVPTISGTGVDSGLAFGQEAYPVPSDLNYFIPQTGWDRNFRWQLLGPVNAQEWQVLKSGISPVGPRLRYRLMGAGVATAANQVSNVTPQIFPPTTLGQTVFTLSQNPLQMLLVSLDGAVLYPTTDYTVTGNVLTLANGTLAGQNLFVVMIGTPISTTQGGVGPMMIYINPAPYVPSGQASPISDQIVMEYASVLWVAQSASPTTAVQTSYQLDTDVSTIPEDLITMSLKWRMLKAIGMAWADEFQEYDDKVCTITGRTVMARNLPLNARASGIRLLNSQNVPDTGFGS